jgi:hypothetical protein
LNKSAQLFPQAIVPCAHVAEQAPWEQNGVAPPQTTPQLPQFIGSEAAFTQAAPQAFVPPVQAHTLFEQICVFAQTVPHVPQLVRSFVRLTQTLPVSVWQVESGAVQVAWPVPPFPPDWFMPADEPPDPGLPPLLPVSGGSLLQLAAIPRSPMSPKANTLRMGHLLVDPCRWCNPM